PRPGPRALGAGPRARRDRPFGRAVGRSPGDLPGERSLGGDRFDRGAGGPARLPPHAGPRGGRPGPRAARRRRLPAADGGPTGPARGAARAGRDLGSADHGDRPLPGRTGRSAAEEPGRGGRAGGRFARSFQGSAPDGRRRGGRVSRLRQTVRFLLHLEDTPNRVALAFGIGLFIAFFPLLGIHTGLALGIAVVFRLSRVAL